MGSRAPFSSMLRPTRFAVRAVHEPDGAPADQAPVMRAPTAASVGVAWWGGTVGGAPTTMASGAVLQLVPIFALLPDVVVLFFVFYFISRVLLLEDSWNLCRSVLLW
eukprot:TRINITY_DN12671_c0_g1_i1.p2 TRINITY_DN12671_c0_g1~~TRINITY_DN12671_c0_g1_i1.p2  ORF type:complete len:107 (+),score=19.21 TRINITY_DN12671_c0_g1_i1:162-482(+)